MVTSNSTDAPTRVHARLVRSLTQPQPAGRDGRATDGGPHSALEVCRRRSRRRWPRWRRCCSSWCPSGGPLHALVTSCPASSSSPPAPSARPAVEPVAAGAVLPPRRAPSRADRCRTRHRPATGLATAPLAGHTSWSVVDVATGQVLVTQGELLGAGLDAQAADGRRSTHGARPADPAEDQGRVRARVQPDRARRATATRRWPPRRPLPLPRAAGPPGPPPWSRWRGRRRRPCAQPAG